MAISTVVDHSVGLAAVRKELANIASTSAGLEDCKEEWYKNLVRSVLGNGCPVEDPTDSDKTRQGWFKENMEQPYKEENGVKSMETAYRSSKSVINRAIKVNVELLDEHGTPKGKTAVENECKEAEGAKSNEDKALGLLTTVSKVIDKMIEEGEDTATIARAIEDLEIKASFHASTSAAA